MWVLELYLGPLPKQQVALVLWVLSLAPRTKYF